MRTGMIGLLLFLSSVSGKGQPSLPSGFKDHPRKERGVRAVFYNLENLFDTRPDSTTGYNAYTPSGDNHWDRYRFRKKLHGIAKTLLSIGGWEPPSLIGVCEVENRQVLRALMESAPLEHADLKAVHEDSPDHRGTDVALLYRPDKFSPVHTEAVPVKLPFDESRGTRDILYVKGLLPGEDTLHLFINHWPSRWGGQLATEKKRLFAASILRSRVDSLLGHNSEARLLIIGDFNDTPENKSIHLLLHGTDSTREKGTTLHHLLEGVPAGKGTHKYQGHWSVLDHIIVSPALHTESRKWKHCGGKIFRGEWLLSPDLTHTGKKPFRTYTGPQYKGGFSDHLPVYTDLMLTP